MTNIKYSNDNQYDPVRAAHIVGEAEGYDAGYQAGIDAAIAALPEKKSHTESDRNIAYREGFNDSTAQAKSNLLKLKKGEV